MRFYHDAEVGAHGAPYSDMITSLGRQHGYILLPVVLLITLVAAVAFMINNESALDSGITHSKDETAQVEYLAQAGFQHALWGINNSGCSGNLTLPTTPFGNGSYTATVTSPVTSSSYTLNATQDTWLKESAPTENHGGDIELSVKAAAGDNMRALYQFDLSSIPAGSQIASATAWFYVTGNDDKGTVDIHEATAVWTEGTADWVTMNDKFAAPLIASIPAQASSAVWVQVNIASLVQSWVNGSINNGIMLLANSDAVESKYGSREAGSSQRPRIEVVATSGTASPVTITAQGTLTGNPTPANDITRTLTRAGVPAYQPTSNQVLQPDAAAAEDAYIWEWSKNSNYGTADETWVASTPPAFNTALALFRFDISALPPGVKILNASLSLYHRDGNDPDVPVTAHRIRQSWNEQFVTWNRRDNGISWNTAGGDFDAAAVATTSVGPGSGTRYEWDIASLVQGWVNGVYMNDGVALRTVASGMSGERFDTSDHADPTRRPRLSITYACECGSTCLAPQGSGNILMVVSDVDWMTQDELKKKALFESWGYSVNLISQWDVSWNFDALAVNNDVVYVSEGVDHTTWGMVPKLAATTLGVVNEEGLLNADLGISNNAGVTVGSALNVTDTSHYITTLFPAGPLEIYHADMQQLVVYNGPAPDLQVLADVGGNSALVTLETGATLKGGAIAAGRRVMLPLGTEAKFNWDYLNSNGRLMVQRAIQWGTGNTGGAPARHLLFVAASLTPTAQEQLRIDLIESWGYAVNVIDDNDSQANFDVAVAANEVAYVPETIDAVALGTRLTAATIGVVIEEWTNDFGIATDFQVKSRDEIDIIDNTHYITSPYSLGLLTYLSSLQPVTKIDSGLAPDLIPLGMMFNTGSQWKEGLAVINPGGSLAGGGTAAGRRVQLPWGDVGFDINALNAAGKDIMQRAIEWAEGAVSGSAPGLNVLMIVGNLTLSSKDVGYKALMESWGHTVTLIDDGASQADYDTAMAAADVIYVSGSSLGASMLDKATNTTKGLVNEVNGKIDNFGFSSSTSSTANFDTFSITNPGHYITEPFASNPVTVFTSSLTNPVPAGTLAPDLQKVGFDGSTLALGTLDTGATRYDSNPSPGRRVHLPYASAETTDMTADGKTILQRSLEWAAGADVGGGGGTVPNAHWKLDETTGITSVDSVGGHDGTQINGLTPTTGQLDGALQFNGTNDYINVPHDDTLSLTTFSISAWIRPDTVSGIHAIVYKGASTSEANYHLYTDADEISLGLISGGWEYQITTASANLVAGQWYHLTTTFDGANGEGKHYLDGSLIHTGTIGPSPIMNTGQLTIGTDPFDEFWDGLLDDVRIYDSVLAASEINDLYAAGSGGGGGGGPLPPDSCDGTFRDEFNLRQYDQNDGTLTWATVWQETGETPTSPTGGDIFIANDTSNYQLRLQDDGQTIMREVDLGTAVSATLSFDYRREGLSGSNDYVAVEVSYNGGSSWSELGRFIGTATDPSYFNTSYVLDAGSLSANTRIRFKTPSNGMKDNNGAWFDNIQIQCTP